jgi:nucleoid-associated protein YgaU/predicted chitinase
MPCTSGTSYTVQAGDTLFSIAQAKLGNGNLYTQITNTDGSPVNATTLQVGQVVCLPGGTASSSLTAYTVQAGDTLFSIAQKLLGNGNLDTEITNANGSAVNPTTLQVGQVVYLPTGSASAPAPATPAPTTSNSSSSTIAYTVQSGDTLFSIAQKLLGNGNLYTEITNANGSAVNPTTLQVGQTVYLPGTSSGAPSSSSSSTAPSGGGGFASIVSQQMFSQIFPNANPIYTYEGLVSATQTYPTFCNEGSSAQNQQEAAAFLANVSHESGALVFVNEVNPPEIYCQSDAQYPCASGQTYIGRGPLQLTWNFNYGACGAAIGADLLNQPGLVATDSTITFQTALWFWMTAQPPKLSCHQAISSSGFGECINIINGGLECGQATENPEAANRVQLYQQFCGMLGVSPGNNLTC